MPTKVCIVKAIVFLVVLYGCESWTIKKGECFWIMVLENALESPLDCKEMKPVHLKGNQSWIFTGRTEAEGPVLWPPDAESWLIGRDPEAWKDWGQEEKAVTENDMIGWHHWLSGHESEQTLGDGEGQGRLQSMGSQRVKHSLVTEQQQQCIIIQKRVQENLFLVRSFLFTQWCQCHCQFILICACQCTPAPPHTIPLAKMTSSQLSQHTQCRTHSSQHSMQI